MAGLIVARRLALRLTLFVAGLLALPIWATSLSAAETRRAFVVGVQRYNDGNIQQLRLTVFDAKDVAKDLEEVGFDKKNIKVVTDVRSKEAFEKELGAFLKTVEAGDTVLFYFSGHGFGLEADQTNYLLPGDIKSPFAYTRAQLSEQERKNSDIVRLRIASHIEAYQQNEIAKNGISATDVANRIAEKKPKAVIMILDACRSLATADPNDTQDPRLIKRGSESGSRLVTAHKPPPGFMILYSASFGEQAVERLDSHSRNSLYTEVLRQELQRPGQSVLELAERLKLVVRAIAQKDGFQQEPDFVHNMTNPDEFFLVGSIGRDRFQISQEKCAGDREDWEQIKNLQKRELFERHKRRFDGCGTAELARRALVEFALGSDDPVEAPIAVALSRAVNDCDRLAASEHDRARPPEVAGVTFDKLDADAAITACKRAIEDNPRIVRFLFNLGRAYHKVGTQPGLDKNERAQALRNARFAYDDAAKRGYISALNNLAVLYENDDEPGNDELAIDLYKRAAQQNHPLAMYNLGLHYRDGVGVKRDFVQASEWFAKSAESGFVSAMVELGRALTTGEGLPKNPRRGVEWLQRAADANSSRAKFLLGMTYYNGRIAFDRRGKEDSVKTVRQDLGLALLWLGRVAETGDSTAQANLAHIMERGQGLPNPQPEIAERYWRLAAHGGDAYAQYEFAERLRHGRMLIKQEYGAREAVTLLQRATSQGSPQTALALAQIYRNGELGQERKPIEAMRLAYRTIELAVQADPTSEDGNPFHEIGAAHLLVEMAKNGEAVDAAGRPLLTQEEIDRLERYYGAVDPATKQVKVRRLSVPLSCGGYWEIYRPLWVWDWGRAESPTELQFRNLERKTGCTNNETLRGTLIDVFEQAKKNKIAFADLIAQKILTAKKVVETEEKEPNRRRRRR
jgi:uncharacterized protein